MSARRPIRLGMFQAMTTMGQWRLPGNTSTGFLDLQHWVAMAQRLDAAGVDFLFLADDYAYPVVGGHVVPRAVASAVQFPKADPVVLLSALALATERLGLVTTVSTTVERPQVVARRFATLDHLTGGRLGWNVVTGAGQNASALLFGEPMIPHDERYERAEEHLRLAMELWEGCWEDDALVEDREAGVYADPAKVHEIDRDGRFHRARGVLTVPPSPQRTPLLFQAGASSSGRGFAADFAEGVFLASEPAATATQIAAVRDLLDANGRGRDAVVFLSAGTFVVAPTEEEALAKRAAQSSFWTLEDAAAAYAFFTGLDLTTMDPDGPLTTTATETGRTNVERFSGAHGAPVRTVRQILEEFQKNSVMGAPFVGDPVQVVDQAEAFLDETGADGFLVQPDPTGTFDDFLDLVLPELRRRGLVAQPDAAPTLRQRMFPAGDAHLPASHPGAAFRRTGAPV
ncbi:NtaA/DmoA family FMN-dependent monooxygenase [uncultured Amnibacterium sp.]|uniref:NtaA/DmoA family FMN-dependent monooxygenase n=1 Tax=uncultured Amnibacterium sp. TaxID=1631851 RepID=UPI0035CBE10E